MIQFSGTGSSDPDGSIATYAWTFGDGGTGTGATPTHAYTSAGSYTVVLTVTHTSAASNSASTTAVVSAPVSPPLAPSGLSATLSKTKVVLVWTDNSGNESGFKIERSSHGVTFTQIATVGANVTSYTNTGVKKTFRYRVRASNGGGNSAYSNTVRVP